MVGLLTDSNLITITSQQRPVFAARRYASALYAVVECLCVCVCLSRAHAHYFIKIAKPRIAQTTPHDSPWTKAFYCQRSPRNSKGIIPYGDTKCMLKSTTFEEIHITRCNLKTVQDRRIVSIKVEYEKVIWALSNNYVADDLSALRGSSAVAELLLIVR